MAITCEGCGGPLTVHEGQRLIINGSVTYYSDGHIEVCEPQSAWCGRCIDEWNERLGFSTHEHA